MAADLTLINASNGSGEAVRANVTANRTTGSTSLSVDSVTNWPAKFIATYGKIDSTGNLGTASARVFRGHLSGSLIIIDSFAPGYADNGNDVGDVVVIKPATDWADNIGTSLLVSHNSDGTLKNSVVTAAKLADGSVGSTKIDWSSFAPVFGNISTVTISATYQTVASFTVPAGQSGKYEILANILCNNNGNTGRDFVAGIRVGTGTIISFGIVSASNSQYFLTVPLLYEGNFTAGNVINLVLSAPAATGVVSDARGTYSIKRIG